MPRPSRQRALIALRSYRTLKAAAKSAACDPSTLLRMTVGDEELTRAYEECVYGVLAQRKDAETEAAKRKKEEETPPNLVKLETRRLQRGIAANGGNPRIARAVLHKRLNHQRRQEKMADLEEAIDAVDSRIDNPIPTPPVVEDTVVDRWCRRCRDYRVDDPCEECGCHTVTS